MYLVEIFTKEDDHHECVFATYPSDIEIVSYIEENDWLAQEFSEFGLKWHVSHVDFIDNTQDIEIDFE